MSERQAGAHNSAHDAQMELLAAYLDDELLPEERAQVERHIRECASCRRELRAQTAVHARLAQEGPIPASGDLAERVMARVMESRSPALTSSWQSRLPRHRIRSFALGSGWLVAATLAGLLISRGAKPKTDSGMGMTMGPPVSVSVDSQPGTMASAVLAQFVQVADTALPVGSLDKVQRELPFTIPALTSPHMRILAAWVTVVDGHPAAAIAYRCHDRLVVQYVVSESQFFRHPQVRRAIAKQGVYAVGNGSIHTIAWPGQDSGSFLVGEFTAADLASMRS